MNLLYKDAIDQKIFINMEPKLLVQMHYGSIVYMVKGHLQGNFKITEETIRNAIGTCWNAVTKEQHIAS
jgi:hypothetical protein